MLPILLQGEAATMPIQMPNSANCVTVTCAISPRASVTIGLRGRGGFVPMLLTTTQNQMTAKKKASNSSSNNTEPHKNHCNATDKKSPNTQLWKNMRKAIKEGRDPSQVSNHEEVAGGSSIDALQQMISNYASYMPGGGVASRARERERHRMSAMARGGARQRRSYNTDDSIHGRGTSTSTGMYGSVTAEAAAAASIPASGGRTRSAARSVVTRRRNRSSTGSEGRAPRPAPHDHRQRIRTQQMLEDLYK
mmetsp:Transcript_14234/g.23208  ORF Transcript_14234/g.23208 Transcript_14234/m.23208 type:complete len:250 (-) Transcript_14234:379-1128(-)